MKAYVIDHFGTSDSFHIADLTKPELLPNHVLIKAGVYATVFSSAKAAIANPPHSLLDEFLQIKLSKKWS